jgi:hypothetical protein
MPFPLIAAATLAITAAGAGASFYGQQQATEASEENVALQNAIASRNADRTNKYNRRLVERQNEYNDKAYDRAKKQWKIDRRSTQAKNEAIGEMVRIQSAQERLRMETMKLDADQAKREAIRQMMLANAQSQVAGVASGASPGSSAVEGAMAGNRLVATTAQRNINRAVVGAGMMAEMNRNLFQQNAIVSRGTRQLSPMPSMTQMRPPLTGAMLQGMPAGGTWQGAGQALMTGADAISRVGSLSSLGKPTAPASTSSPSAPWTVY